MPEYAVAEGVESGDVVILTGEVQIVIPEGETFTTTNPEEAAVLELDAATEKVSDDPPLETPEASAEAPAEPVAAEEPITAPDEPVEQANDQPPSGGGVFN